MDEAHLKETLHQIVSKLDIQKYRLISLMNEIISKARETNNISEEEIESTKSDILSPISKLIELISELNSIDKYTTRFLNKKIEDISRLISEANIILINSPLDVEKFGPIFNGIESNVDDIFSLFRQIEGIKYYKEYNKEADKLIKELKDNNEKLLSQINKVEVIADDLKNKKLHEIFEDDSKKFKLIARFYEMAFYLIVAVLIIYFLGLTFYVNNFNFLFVDAGFPEKIHGNISPEFYIQKISLLILSTTLAAFLLKRSFMNRRLADDAYRTAKELDALPRYMEGMSDEMKEKIRFDLAYKYFGNGINHDSYTSGENLMHENIKANTDFIKAVKDLSPKVEVPKAEAPKENKVPKVMA